MKIFLIVLAAIIIISAIAYGLGSIIEMDLNVFNWSEENRGGVCSLIAILLIFPIMIFVFKKIIDLCD